MDFYQELFKGIEENIYNDFHDNWDFISLGKSPRRRNDLEVIDSRPVLRRLTEISPSLESFRKVWSILANDSSKRLYLDLILYKLLGWERYKLPLNNGSYFADIQRLEAECVDKSDGVDASWIGGESCRLHKTLVPLPSGQSTKLYYSAAGLYGLFCLGQYQYREEEISVAPAPGDTVIDGGSCWGDSAILFADLVGEWGHVYSFECLPENVATFNLNMKAAGDLAKRVILCPQALWSEAKKNIHILSNGPGTCTLINQNKSRAVTIETESIDNLIVTRNLAKINYIKMDIEGAELEALKGAESCLRQFRPKLAISIYHNDGQDLIDVPLWLDGLGLGYKFYLGHYSILQWETVLYAIAA